MANIARLLHLIILAFVLGATLWFFFLQAPALVKKMGRTRFVPLQMHLSALFFKSVSVALAVMLAASLAHSSATATTWFALVALLGALMNHFVVLPRALRAGAQSLREERNAPEPPLHEVASEGAGSGARFWHRMVVLFVLVMVGGLLPHAYSLVAI